MSAGLQQWNRKKVEEKCMKCSTIQTLYNNKQVNNIHNTGQYNTRQQA